MLIELPKSKDLMENPMGFPTSFELPIIKDLTKYKNTLTQECRKIRKDINKTDPKKIKR